MTTTTTNHLETATDFLGAWRDGVTKRWIYVSDETGHAYAVSERELLKLGESLADDSIFDAYGPWQNEASLEDLGPVVRARLSWCVPPVCQGQIVTRSYGISGETAYRRWLDWSDLTVRYERADASELADGAWDPINREPGDLDWQPCVVIE